MSGPMSVLAEWDSFCVIVGSRAGALKSESRANGSGSIIVV